MIGLGIYAIGVIAFCAVATGTQAIHEFTDTFEDWGV